ncbi:MAG: hypothetical protein IAF08_01815, partial [Rhizobacter sp.]|nr:hypothetical protein [Chlorobiales bacterium]
VLNVLKSIAVMTMRTPYAASVPEASMISQKFTLVFTQKSPLSQEVTAPECRYRISSGDMWSKVFETPEALCVYLMSILKPIERTGYERLPELPTSDPAPNSMVDDSAIFLEEIQVAMSIPVESNHPVQQMEAEVLSEPGMLVNPASQHLLPASLYAQRPQVAPIPKPLAALAVRAA